MIMRNKKILKPLKLLRSRQASNNTTPTNTTSSSSDGLLNQIYRKLSGQALDVAVKPQLIGETPLIDSNDQQTLTFYVLKEYSRSNSLLIDLQTKEHNIPPALQRVSDGAHHIDENAAIIFLHHRNAKNNEQLSPRLTRLVTASRQFPQLKIRLIPVTILWGRAPEKEDSLFKLLVADNWQEPSISKQLFNIGIMGRDTFVQFHPAQSLQQLIETVQTPNKNAEDKSSSNTALITAHDANSSITLLIQQHINQYLDKQRASILGPDLSDRRNVVDKLLYSKNIKEAIEKESQASGQPITVVRKQAKSYLNEITSDYSYPVVRFFDRFLTWLWTQLYDGVEVQHFERVRELATDYEIIYVPCHRSHIDYLLLSYIIYKNGLSIPYVAAGNNLNIPILGQILRSGGAFFMRRSFKDNPLYGTVFKEYLYSILQRNTPVEYFIEGGRSRTGRLLPPKLGMISMTVQSYLRQTSKPIVFIPTYIGYERIMEGATYIGELKGKPKESESLLGLLKTTRKIEQIFGTVHLSFGTPLYLENFLEKFSIATPSESGKETDEITHDGQFQQNFNAMIDNIGVKIMQHINKAAVINPVSLLSLVLLSTPKAALDENSCREQISLYQRIATNLPYDDDTYVTTMPPQDIIDYGIKLKLIERTPHVLGDMIRVASHQAALLSYFRNNILHAFILSSFLSALIQRNGRIARSRLDRIVSLLYPFLQTEFFLKYPQRNITDTISQKLDNLIEQGLVVNLGNDLLGVPETNSEQYQQLMVLAAPVEQSLERYFMTLALLAQQGSNQLTANQVVDLCHLLGQRLSVLYADDIPDFFDRALFTSFVNALIRLDYVQKNPKNEMLIFDHRINDIAHHARFVLSPDVMQILQHIADLNDKEITEALSKLHQKPQRKFSRKR